MTTVVHILATIFFASAVAVILYWLMRRHERQLGKEYAVIFAVFGSGLISVAAIKTNSPPARAIHSLVSSIVGAFTEGYPYDRETWPFDETTEAAVAGRTSTEVPPIPDDMTATGVALYRIAAEVYSPEPVTNGVRISEWDGIDEDRYLLKPLYNLFFTRDASSTVYNRVLVNSMSFEVRERETLIYEAIFRHFFHVDTLNAMAWDRDARTEGGDVQIAGPDLLCIGQGIRTNTKGIKYLAQTFAKEREQFNILVQELPQKPESFIHLDMVFTFLGKHQCMAFEPMLKKTGLFAGKDTTLITIYKGNIS